MRCPYNDVECPEVPEGKLKVVCPVHGKSLTKDWRLLCRTQRDYYENYSQREKSTQKRRVKSPKLGLGDVVERALTKVGITKKRVEKWLGRPCGCSKRKERLNQLGAWASRILEGRTNKAKEHLEELIDD